MSVVGSLPSSVSSPSEDIPTPIIKKEQTESVDEEYSNNPSYISYCIISGDQLNANIKKEQTESVDEECSNKPSYISYCIICGDHLNANIKNEIKPIEHKCLKSTRYTYASHGPTRVRVRRHDSLTLKTGRRSQFLILEDDAALKRENARKRKEKSAHIKSQLIVEINKLKNHQKDLLSELENLQSLKNSLEKQCQQIKIEACTPLCQ